MKISNIDIKGFKRFTHLQITNIPQTAKLVIIVGPNGSGKSSLFDALLIWYREIINPYMGRDELYYPKMGNKNFQYSDCVKINFHKQNVINKELLKGKFYFRSAYRNQADFTISTISNQKDPAESMKLSNLIQNDATVEENYQRLVSLTLKSVYDEENNDMSVKDLRGLLIGRIRQSLNNIFDDLNLSSIGDPLRNGSFYFEKGQSKDFHYKNLSGGEKAAFDIILDLIIKSSYYSASIYCIDEPETHMHTRLQASLLQEIYDLTPQESQLWINTHSLGLLKKAKEIERINPGTIAFLNFDNLDFDKHVVIEPQKIDKEIWSKFIEIALDDYSQILAPRHIVLCEGTIKGRNNKSFDAQVFARIFSDKYPEVSFFSAGGSSEIEDANNIALHIVKEVLKNPRIQRVTDRDDKSQEEINELKQAGIRVLKKRHIESYLLSDEIVKKLCIANGQEDKIDEIIEMKKEMIKRSVLRGNPADDVKSASPNIYVELKRKLNLTQCGGSKDAFLRDTMASLITDETETYNELEKEIFGE